MTNKISRSQWDQITKRVHLAKYIFDPKWKCLIDGQKYTHCPHSEDEQHDIIAQVKARETA